MYVLFLPSINQYSESTDIVEWREVAKAGPGSMWPKKEILQWLRANVKSGCWTYAIGRPDWNISNNITGIYLYFDNKEDMILFKLSYVEKVFRYLN
jgi:hypothetical protein